MLNTTKQDAISYCSIYPVMQMSNTCSYAAHAVTASECLHVANLLCGRLARWSHIRFQEATCLPKGERNSPAVERVY